MESGKTGGHFESSTIIRKPHGNVLMYILMGGGAFNELRNHTIPYGWGKYIYAPHISTVNGELQKWIRYNMEDNSYELIDGPNMGLWYLVNNDSEGKIHYVSSFERSNRVQKIDLESQTITSVSNSPYAGKMNNVLYANNSLYFVDASSNNYVTLGRFDLETETITKTKFDYGEILAGSPRSLTYIGEGKFYLTLSSSNVSSPPSNRGVNLLLLNENNSSVNIVAKDIPVEYKYPDFGTIKNCQHFLATHTFAVGNRIYMCMTDNAVDYPKHVWGVLDMELNKFVILDVDRHGGGYPVVTNTSYGPVYYRELRYTYKEWFKVEFQKD